MRFSVVSLRRSPAGLWTARKAIPADVRRIYGKREEKKSWPGNLTSRQAKAELAAWLGPIEERIALLRSGQTGAPASLTKRQCLALAGEWYRLRVEALEARFTDTPGTWDWDADILAILPEEGADEHDALRLRPIPVVVEERDALLAERGLLLDPRSADQLLQEMLALYLDFLRLMQRRVVGDFGPDPVLETLPDPESALEPKRKGRAAVSVTRLFEEFAATGAATPHTVAKWRAEINSFFAHLGHDDAATRTRPIRWAGAAPTTMLPMWHTLRWTAAFEKLMLRVQRATPVAFTTVIFVPSAGPVIASETRV